MKMPTQELSVQVHTVSVSGAFNQGLRFIRDCDIKSIGLAVSGGYGNTTSAATSHVSASPSAGDIVAIKDYATADTI